MNTHLKKLLYICLGVLLAMPLIAAAVPVTVPSSPGSGYGLISTTTGAYIASSTGLITCTGSASCGAGSYVFGNALIINATAGAGSYPFTPSTFGSLNVSATTTPILDNAGLIAATSTFGTVVATSSITDNALTNGNCVQGGANGLLTSAAGACGTSSGSPFPFTPQSWGNSTSTTLGFLNGFLANAASSSITGSLIVNQSNSGNVPLTVKGASGQSVDIADFQNNTGTNYFTVGSNGTDNFYQQAQFTGPTFGQFQETTSGAHLDFKTVGGAGSYISFTPNATTTTYLNDTGNFGYATSSSVWSEFAIHDNASDPFNTVFAIGSSTSNSTTTLFAIDNAGNIKTQIGNGLVLSGGAGTNLSAYGGSTCAANTFGGTLSATGVVTCTAASSSPIFWINNNRTDTYTPDGGILRPYTSMSGMLAAVPASSAGYSFNLAPGTYVDGPPDTFPNNPFMLFGNQAVYVPASGVTFPNSFDIFDLTIVGAVTESDNSLNIIHQFNNGVISNPNGAGVKISGNATLSNMVLAASTTLTQLPGSLTNVAATASFGNFINFGGQLNLNDDFIDFANPVEYDVSATTTGWYAGNFGNLNMLGFTLIATSTGGAINTQNGATSTINNIFDGTILTGGAGVTAGTAATAYCGIDSTNLTGAYVWPTGSNFVPCYDASAVSLFNGGIGTTTPKSEFAIQANANAVSPYLYQNLFTIASSTASATSTLFNISNTGTITTSMTGTQCVHEISGVLSGTGSDCGSGGGGIGDPFTHPFIGYSASTSPFMFGTSTPAWAQLTLATSTVSQLSLSDSSLTDNPWDFRSVGGNLYISTSSPSTFATSTFSAISLVPGSPTALVVGATSTNALSNATFPTTVVGAFMNEPNGTGVNASTTMVFGDTSTTTSVTQIQMNNSAGSTYCLFVNVSGSLAVVSGKCN